MNLYKISQELTLGYFTYDSAIVAAESTKKARYIHPNGKHFFKAGKWRRKTKKGNIKKVVFDKKVSTYYMADWVRNEDISAVKVELIGTTNLKKGVVLASYEDGYH